MDRRWDDVTLTEVAPDRFVAEVVFGYGANAYQVCSATGSTAVAALGDLSCELAKRLKQVVKAAQSGVK